MCIQGVSKYLGEFGPLPFIVRTDPFSPQGVLFILEELMEDSVNIEFKRCETESTNKEIKFSVAIPKKRFSIGFDIITACNKLTFKIESVSKAGVSQDVAFIISVGAFEDHAVSLEIVPALTKNINGTEFNFK
jgi:hypothetical protein